MRWAVRHGTPLTVVGGGHSGHSVAHGALALSLQRLSAVRADPAARVVHAGGGATMGAIAAAAAQHGMAVTTGARPRCEGFQGFEV